MDRNKLQRMLAGLSNRDSGLGDAFKSVEAEMKKVAEKLREEAKVQTVDESRKKIKELKEQIQLILKAVENLKSDIIGSERNLTNSLNKALDSLKSATATMRTADTERAKLLADETQKLRSEIKEISDQRVKIPDLTSQILTIQRELEQQLSELKEDSEQSEELAKEHEKRLDKLEQDLIDLRKKAMSALADHGGNANRNILVGGNSSTLSRYTDLNIKAGSNVTLTYTTNDNLKTTDLTIASSGGGGSVIGTTRSINSIATSQTAGDTTTTDYVYIATVGVAVTLPTAVANTNLYTIKNTAASSVLVATTGGETIDDQTNAILNTRYTSIDLISDNANWHIT